MKKAVIFDLDGTLLNTLDSIAYCSNLALKHFGLTEIPTDAVPQFVGHGAQRLAEGVFEYSSGESRVFDDFRSYFLDVYDKNGLYKTLPYDGIYELIDRLQVMDIKLAILSNKPDLIVRNAADSLFCGKFDAVFGKRDGVPSKPDPLMVNNILEGFEIPAEDCIYCGDSRVDIETAKNAGAFAAGAGWGFYGDSQFEMADAVLYKPSDLLKYI